MTIKRSHVESINTLRREPSYSLKAFIEAVIFRHYPRFVRAKKIYFLFQIKKYLIALY